MARAYAGVITIAELAPVIAALESPTSDTDIGTCLYVLGRSALYGSIDPEPYRALVERYLDARDDPWVVNVALWVLVGYWGPEEPYLDHLLAIINGVEWTIPAEYVGIDDARGTALFFAGQYLAEHEHPRLLSAVLQVMEDSVADTPEADYLRESAELALNKAMGAATFDPAVVAAVKQRLVAERLTVDIGNDDGVRMNGYN
jgi:hypothetical protein